MLMSALAALILTSSPSPAETVTFNYQNGKCVNSQGVEGLNIAVFGQCADMRNAVLGGLPLEDVDFSGSRFDSAQLQHLKMNRSNFTGVSFESADVSGVQMMGATFKSTVFKNAVVQNVAFAEATFSDVTFEGANLEGMDLTYMECPKCDFKGAKMKGVNLESANFSGADFTGAILKSADFKATNLVEAKMDGVEFVKASFLETNMQGASIKKGDFRRVILAEVNFTKANLSEADLGATTFASCKVEGAVFTGAHYDKRTVLPFSAEQAEKFQMAMDSRAADAFVEINGRGYVKVFIKENLTDPAILKACQAEGLLPPCNNEKNGDYSDENCLDVGFRDGGQPMASVAQVVCGKPDPRNCAPLENVFQYMGGKYNGGCGTVNGQWCVDGNSTANAYGLCVDSFNQP